MLENAIGKQVVDAAVQVHRELGPGLLETVYEVVLARELEYRGLRVERLVPVPIVYRGIRFEEGLRADIIVKAGLGVFASWREDSSQAEQMKCAEPSGRASDPGRTLLAPGR